MSAARKARELGEALVEVGGNTNEARKLIKRGADVNYVVKFMHEGVERSMTPLVQAASLGHANILSVLIERGADVNKPEPLAGFTTLH